MRRPRITLSLAVAVLVLTGLVFVLRHFGYLGGRASSGPLDLSVGNGATMIVCPGQRAQIAEDMLRNGGGQPVHVERLHVDAPAGVQVSDVTLFDPTRSSPGLDAPVGRQALATTPASRTIPAHAQVGVSYVLTVKRPGRYVVPGMTVDYRAGWREFEGRNGIVVTLQQNWTTPSGHHAHC